MKWLLYDRDKAASEDGNMTRADAAGHEIAGFSKTGNNGLAVAAAFLTLVTAIGTGGLSVF